ncbi:MAG: PTS transporter subunit EIIC, partial [Eggerthellaceae bacterium]|nr:PTS transporter subunit EIIC [Eggerthellaceae bacterium]
MSDYKKNTEMLIDCLGGASNIVSVTNCMTRLRVTVRNETPVDEAQIRKGDDVLGLVHDRANAYEIVVGPGKSRKYADQCHELGLSAGSDTIGQAGADWKQNKEELRSQQKNSRVKSALKLLGDIFIPLIPGVIAAGLCAGFAGIIAQAVPNYDSIKGWSLVYSLLSLISVSFMTYLTAWAGYRAAERFGATPILGGMLGMITSLDGINTISQLLGLYDADNPLNSILRDGKGGVLSVIAGVFLLSIVEKKIRNRMPESLDVIFTPLLTLLICAIPYILIVMPVFGYISSAIVWVFSQLCLSDHVIVRIIAGYVSAALFLPLVATGMHHGLVALYSVQLQELGYV